MPRVMALPTGDDSNDMQQSVFTLIAAMMAQTIEALDRGDYRTAWRKMRLIYGLCGYRLQNREEFERQLYELRAVLFSRESWMQRNTMYKSLEWERTAKLYDRLAYGLRDVLFRARVDPDALATRSTR